MGLFPQQFIDDLRLQANIVQVVAGVRAAEARGDDVQGPLPVPFGEDAVVSPSIRTRGSSIASAAASAATCSSSSSCTRRSAFQDAVRMLAQKFGVSLPEPVDGSGDDARRDAALREALLKVHEVAALYFREQLAAPAGARARQQLAGARRHAADDRAAGARLRAAVAGRLEEPACWQPGSRRRCCSRAGCWCSATAAKSSIGSATG